MEERTEQFYADPEKKLVVIVAMGGQMLLNFAGPADVFTYADKSLSELGHATGYQVAIVSPTAGKKIQAQSGAEIHCRYSTQDLSCPIDTLIIAGNDFAETTDAERVGFYAWLLGKAHENTRRICSICGGAFALAKAGLLDGKKATTHWDLSDRLRKQYPLVQVDSNAFFAVDGNVYTSGGVSSGIDLALALVEEDHGRDLALAVARKLVFYLSRPGFQAQFGNLLPAYESSNIADRLKGWLLERLHEPLDVAGIAEHLNMSPRNFTRVFHRQTGLPPAKFIEKLRVETARRYLEETDLSLEKIAETCGLSNLISMRRTFLRHLMVTPSDYRRSFRSSLKSFQIDELLHSTVEQSANNG